MADACASLAEVHRYGKAASGFMAAAGQRKAGPRQQLAPVRGRGRRSPEESLGRGQRGRSAATLRSPQELLSGGWLVQRRPGRGVRLLQRMGYPLSAFLAAADRP